VEVVVAERVGVAVGVAVKVAVFVGVAVWDQAKEEMAKNRQRSRPRKYKVFILNRTGISNFQALDYRIDEGGSLPLKRVTVKPIQFYAFSGHL
jgi:hypothetical protein